MKKIIRNVCIVCFLLLCLLGLYLMPQLRTICSVKKVSDQGLYTMVYQADYKLESLRNANLSSASQLEQWISKNLFFGYPIEADETKFGCTTFLAKNKEGDSIFGRNYDYDTTEPMVIFSQPKNGYKSIGVADLSFIGVDQDCPADSLLGRITSLASPVVTLEGMNEKGLGIAILELETEEIHQDQNKPDLLIYNVPRLILDTCQSVEEATELLATYDIHSDFNYPYHFFICDKSGKSRVVEWVENEMVVVEDNCATNFQLAPGKEYGFGIGQERYDIVKEGLKKEAIDEKQAMMLLEDAVSVWNGDWGTQWSCVFNLEKLTLDICIDVDYSKSYSFSFNDF
ncbi:MAG: C45 family peptidase [Bacillota bacterium]|nr:C45 family peptidase [Bacillota bacterium]